MSILPSPFRVTLMMAGLAFSLALNLAMGPARAEEPALPGLFGGPFELVDHNGATRTDEDFAGRFMLVYFGYSYCPDICPTDLALISQAMEEIGQLSDKVQPIFITVDPARDRPELLKEYVANFHPRLIGLTGTEAQVRAAAKAYRVHRSKVPQPDDGEDAYLVSHSSLAYLMGPEGSFVTLIPHDTPAEKIAAILRKYLGAAGS